MVFSKDFHVGDEQGWVTFAKALKPYLAAGQRIALVGDMGAGKSSCARALIRDLVGQPALHVPSPTFTLVQTYDTPLGPLWHWDLYRMKTAEELFEAGWDEGIAQKAIMLVEWPSRAPQAMAIPDMTIAISDAQGGGRRVHMEVTGAVHD